MLSPGAQVYMKNLGENTKLNLNELVNKVTFAREY